MKAILESKILQGPRSVVLSGFYYESVGDPNSYRGHDTRETEWIFLLPWSQSHLNRAAFHPFLGESWGTVSASFIHHFSILYPSHGLGSLPLKTERGGWNVFGTRAEFLCGARLPAHLFPPQTTLGENQSGPKRSPYNDKNLPPWHHPFLLIKHPRWPLAPKLDYFSTECAWPDLCYSLVFLCVCKYIYKRVCVCVCMGRGYLP